MIIAPPTAVREYLKRFAAVCSDHEYPPGSRLFQQSTQVRDVYFIAVGFVKFIRLEANGNQAFVGLCAEGSLLGVGSATADHVHLFDAVAATPCRLYRMPAEQFRKLLRSDAQFSATVHELRTSIENAHVEHYARLACWSSRMRLLGLLSNLVHMGQTVRHDGSADMYLRLPLKIGEVAQYLAVTPAHLSRLLTQLEHERMVYRRSGWIVIPSERIKEIRNGFASLQPGAEEYRGPRGIQPDRFDGASEKLPQNVGMATAGPLGLRHLAKGRANATGTQSVVSGA